MSKRVAKEQPPIDDPEAKELFAKIEADYVLQPHHRSLLLEACRALSRANQARQILDREGLTSTDRFGQVKSHPATLIERDNRGLFSRLLRELGLDLPSIDAQPARPGRKPQPDEE
ncbi:MAG: P27 family phage terminase small subunit [Planctomycetota bacterium]